MKPLTLASKGVVGSLSKPVRVAVNWPFTMRPSVMAKLLVSHVLVPPAMEAILGSPGNQVQAFLAAGHVCMVMGYTEYEPIARRYGVPIVVTGSVPTTQPSLEPGSGRRFSTILIPPLSRASC